jgi:hypothetical protein
MSALGLSPGVTARRLILRKVFFMEPIDTDFEYTASQPRELNLRSRFNWLYIIPILGVLWVVYLTLAVIFQWPVTGIVDPVMTLMIVVFFAFVALLFWAMAPKENRD